jgi:HEAT repeat protein
MAFKCTASLALVSLLGWLLLAPARAGADDADKLIAIQVQLSSADAEVRLQALKDLKSVSYRSDDPIYVDVLALLDDPNDRVRAYAAYHAYHHRDQELAAQTLLDVLTGTDDEALYAAAVNLLMTDLADPQFVAPLWNLVDNPDQYVRAHSLTMLHNRFHAADLSMIPRLREVLETDGYSAARTGAVRLLGDLAPENPAANAALIGALDNKDSSVVKEASLLLPTLGPAAEPAIPKLIVLLEDECYDCLYTGISNVLVELGEIPELRKPITDELLVLLKSDDKYLIHRASKILGEMKTTDPRVKSTALEQLNGSFWESRQLGARLLIDVFLDDPATVPPLIALLADRDKYVREYAELALTARQTAAAEAIPALIDNLDYFYAPVRANAVSALAAIGPGDSTALEATRAALSDADEAVRLQAAIALIDAGARDDNVCEVVDALCSAANDMIADHAERLRQQLAGDGR